MLSALNILALTRATHGSRSNQYKLAHVDVIGRPVSNCIRKAWRRYDDLPLVVMCRLRPEARGRAKLSQKKPGQAGPDLWPETAFGPAWILSKPEPAAWKASSKIVGDVLKLSFNYFFWYCTVKIFFKKVQLIPILPRCRVQGPMPTTSFLLI